MQIQTKTGKVYRCFLFILIERELIYKKEDQKFNIQIRKVDVFFHHILFPQNF